MALQGKGYYIWQINNTESGSISAIVNLALQANLSHVLIKIANGVTAYNVDADTGVDLVPPLVRALRVQGLQVWGWHYVYGYNPLGEADRAIARIFETGVDGYVIDAEGEYKQAGRSRAATTFMNRLRASLPGFPIALSSYRYPSIHPIPWTEFLSQCDYNMPQVYWLQAHDPGAQLVRCVREFQNISPVRPIIPTGAAFRERGWSPTPGEVVEFLQTAQTLNLSAANFWEWSNARRNMPEVWDVIANFPWPPTGVVKDVVQQYIDALNLRDIEKLVSLYQPNGVHVTPSRTRQGAEALRGWYTTWLTQTLPDAVFTLTNFSGSGSTRQFSWTATSGSGSVTNGSDTLGLANGKIAYHYSAFRAA